MYPKTLIRTAATLLSYAASAQTAFAPAAGRIGGYALALALENPVLAPAAGEMGSKLAQGIAAAETRLADGLLNLVSDGDDKLPAKQQDSLLSSPEIKNAANLADGVTKEILTIHAKNPNQTLKDKAADGIISFMWKEATGGKKETPGEAALLNATRIAVMGRS